MIINYVEPYYYTENSVSKIPPAILDDTPIVTNNCDAFDRIDNVLDMRILKWTVDNNYSAYKDKPNFNGRQTLLKYISDQKEFCKKNQTYIDQGFHFTKIHKIINKNHHFQYNKNELLKINEQIKINQTLREKLPEIEIESIEEMKKISNGISYNFINPVGKIIGSGFNLTKFDREKYVSVFKTDEDDYYKADIISYEPSLINYYIPDYIKEGFYEENAIKFNLDRSEFKHKFLIWINGGGNNSLGNLFELFPKVFPEVDDLRRKLTGNTFKNVFGRLITTNEKYKRLSYLIQSTAGSLLQEFHLKLHSYNDGSFEIIWSLFDEFLIRGDVYKFVSLFKENYPTLNMKVTKV